MVLSSEISSKNIEIDYKINEENVDREVLLGLQRCKNQIHGRLILAKGTQPMKFVDLKAKLIDLWGILGKWSIISLGRGFYKFAFSFVEDMRNICATGSWNLKPGLPQEYWCPNIIFTIVGGIGSPIALDEATTNRRNSKKEMVDEGLSPSVNETAAAEPKQNGLNLIIDLHYNKEANIEGMERLILNHEISYSDSDGAEILATNEPNQDMVSTDNGNFIVTENLEGFGLRMKRLRLKRISQRGFGNPKSRLVLKNFCLANKQDMVFIVEPMIGFDEARHLSLKRGSSRSSEDLTASTAPKYHIFSPRRVNLSLKRESFRIAQDYTLPIEPSSPRRANSRSDETTLAQARQPSLRRESISIAQDFTLPGDFNVVLGAHECRGPNLPPRLPSEEFELFTDAGILIHLPTRGVDYT
ncbi:hypothetical protein Lal_00018961 [Lupinus albus]|nr:hypothetical protein Lal_00018961 [Lupinus albus]